MNRRRPVDTFKHCSRLDAEVSFADYEREYGTKEQEDKAKEKCQVL